MKTIKFFFLLFFLVSFQKFSFSQIKFEKGYFINNYDQRSECLIKNEDWKFNPVGFDYKISENDKSGYMDVGKVKEFGINGISKFIRADVNIDRSSEKLNELSSIRDPEWSHEELFLKVIMDGNAVLYLYKDKTTKRFFYSVNGSPPEQFIYKQYLIDNKTLAENNGFQRQLWNFLKCETISQKEIENMVYSQRQFENYFKKYYQSKKNSFTEYTKLVKRDRFNLRLKPGITFSSFNMWDTYSVYKPPYWVSEKFDIHFGNKTTFSIGLEFEITMPFQKGKWTILADPRYQFYPSTTIQTAHGPRTIDLTFVECPIGIRHYFFLNDDLKISLSGLIVPNINTDLTLINFEYNDYLRFVPCLSAGLGLNYKRINAELRYYGKHSYTDDGGYGNSVTYPKLSIMMGYQIF